MQTVARSIASRLTGICTNLTVQRSSVILCRTAKTDSASTKIPYLEQNSKTDDDSVCGTGSVQGGVFWDIENIPVKKALAAKRVPEIKQAILHFVKNVNHYNEECPTDKNIYKFIAVARQRGENQIPTTADVVKHHLIENDIELLDLPYSSDPDYCDDAIYDSVLGFTEQHEKCIVVAMTGDVGLIRRINNIDRDFDLIVVTQRAGKKTIAMQKHCDKIKQTNEKGRQQAVYFIDEVIRKCLAGGVPLTFSQLLRLQFSRSDEEPRMDEDHFRWLYSDEQPLGVVKVVPCGRDLSDTVSTNESEKNFLLIEFACVRQWFFRNESLFEQREKMASLAAKLVHQNEVLLGTTISKPSGFGHRQLTGMF